MKWIERHGHGGDIWTAAESFGGDPAALLDFSANINPLAPPPGLLAMLAASVGEIVRYPDPACRKLRVKLGERLGTSVDHILIGNGGAECISLALAALRPRRVGLIHPCFSEYTRSAMQAGCEIVPLFSTAEREFLPTLKELFALVEQVDFLFVGHPNNPTGNHLTIEELAEVARLCAERGVILGVDEAFLDFLPEADELTLLPRLSQYPTVLLFRSLTKMFGIPGLRLGYAIGAPALIARMAARQSAWSVNALAQLAGEWLLDADAFVRDSQAFVAREREWLAGELAALPGVRVCRGKANYLLLHVSGVTGYDLQAALAKRHMLIRNCAMYPGLGDGYVRVAVKTRDDNRRLLAGLADALAKLRGQGGKEG